MTDPEKQAIEAIKEDIFRLSAESLAMQTVLTCMMHRIGEGSVSLRGPILQAFDDAADFAERISIIAGSESAHLPETLRIIEQMRHILVGKGKPQHEV